MKKPPRSLPGSYQYDALDRLSSSNATRRFYQNERIATEIEGTNTRRFVEFDAQPLAVQQGQATTLLATDLQTSVLQHVSAAGTQAYAYTPYGHHPAENGITRLLAFNGEHPEAVTGHYLLGQGYRAYNPVLMRFNSPDSWSPFGEGGINAYAYSNKPLNEVDPTGHAGFSGALKGLLKLVGLRRSVAKKVISPMAPRNVLSRSSTGVTKNPLYTETDLSSSSLSSSTSTYSRSSISSSRVLKIQARPLPSTPSESSILSTSSSLSNRVQDNIYDEIRILKDPTKANDAPHLKQFLDTTQAFPKNQYYDPYVNLLDSKYYAMNKRFLQANKVIRRGKGNSLQNNPE